MIVTEKQAREMWCPYVQVAAAADGGRSGEWYNRLQGGFNCIASECMAFHWHPDAKKDLKDGRSAIADQRDADLFHGAWWDGKYVRNTAGRLHRLIAARAFNTIPEGMFVDHIDGDTLNNRRGNLRIVTKAQNAANAKARGGKSKYRGVCQSAKGRWVAQISRQGVRLCLGTYDTEEDAAAAYDAAAKKVHGDYARLNLETIADSGRRGYCGLVGRPE